MAVEVNNLVKTYGEQKAVNDISFTISKGEIVGFLGPNGAGKSTTMKIATGFLPPSSGTVRINDKDIVEQTQEVKKIVGYLPEQNPLYLDMYVYEYLEFVGKLHGISGAGLRNRINDLVAMIGIEREKHKKIEELSKGYRQRIGLAQALIHDPEVLFLDEPTSGLDPNQIVEIRNLIKELGKEKTVILSSHIMQEVEAICNRAIIINLGKIVADDAVTKLKRQISGQNQYVVEFSNAVKPENLQKIEGIASVNQQSDTVFEITSESDVDPRSKLFDEAKVHDWTILEIRTKESNLENIFHQLTQN